MLRRIAFILVAVTAVAAGCSRTPDKPTASASPTSPTIVNASAKSQLLLGGGALGPLAVPRQDQYAFRQALETKYQNGLHRAVVPVFVDPEGDAIWTGDYTRYRISGCDHGVAVQRVIAQVQGNPAGPDCGVVQEGFVTYPPWDDTVRFRGGLDDEYRQMGRLSQSAVDLTGSAIWNSEYNRYRSNACDHATAQAKVFEEIDTGVPPAVCYVPPPCAFYLNPGPYMTVGPSAGSYSFEVLKYTGLSTCTFNAVNEVPEWVTLTGATSGGDRTMIPFRVTENLGLQRSGRIRVDTQGPAVWQTVIQQDRTFAASIALFDNKESTNSTTECQIKNLGGNPTTCQLVATSRLPEAANRYVWMAYWDYYGGITRRFNQDGPSNTLNISEQCNAAASNNGGDQTTLNVTLTVYDTAGNQQTVVSGQGQQQGFTIRFFPC